jgi:FixJ family two-component response regulator
MTKLNGTMVAATRDEDFVARLRSRGMGVDHAASGRELLDLLQESGGGTVILLDDDLPDVRGSSLLGRIRELDSNVKIVFTVEDFDVELEMEVRREGIHFFLPKPVEWSILERVLSRVVEKETTKTRSWSGAENGNKND